MNYYLIKNMMGFETPVEEGHLQEVEAKKNEYEQRLAMKKLNRGNNELVVSVRYYIAPKDDWDIHNCPIIPVDLS